MAINIDYTPIGSVLGAARLAGVGQGIRTDLAQQQANDLAQRQFALEQEKAIQNARDNAIGTALEYDKLRIVNEQRQADAARQAQSEAARIAAAREQEARLSGQSAFEQKQATDRATKQAADDAAVEEGISKTFTDPREADRARLLYRATGRLPQEVLIPKAGGDSSAAFNLSRTATALKGFLAVAQSPFGEPNPGYTQQQIDEARQQHADVIRQMAEIPQAASGPVAPAPPPPPPAPAVPLNPNLTPDMANQIMRSIPHPTEPGQVMGDAEMLTVLQAVAQLLGKSPKDPLVIERATRISTAFGWSIPNG